jgi:ABC-type transport system involved in multi-copper enzyme maturation permease subunit
MTNELRAEWRKVTTTRLAWILIAVSLVYSVAQVGTLVLIAAPGLMEGLAGAPMGESMLLDPEYITTLLSQTGTASTFVLLLGIIAMTGEFRHMTITTTFLATPRRGRVLVAKMVLFAAIGVAVAVLTLATVLLTTIVALVPFDHAPVTAGTVATVLLGAMIGLALFAVLGVSLGSVITNQVAAIVTALLWVLLLEPLIGLAFPDVGRWLPGGALNAAMDVGLRADFAGGMTSADPLPPWAGMVVLLAYAVALAALGSRTTMRRDIT